MELLFIIAVMIGVFYISTIIHELGHLLMARALGFRVLELALFKSNTPDPTINQSFKFYVGLNPFIGHVAYHFNSKGTVLKEFLITAMGPCLEQVFLAVLLLFTYAYFPAYLIIVGSVVLSLTLNFFVGAINEKSDLRKMFHLTFPKKSV